MLSLAAVYSKHAAELLPNMHLTPTALARDGLHPQPPNPLTHREVTALLQRKSSWVPADVARFTELYAAEHETEKAVATAHCSSSPTCAPAHRTVLVSLHVPMYSPCRHAYPPPPAPHAHVARLPCHHDIVIMCLLDAMHA